MKQARVQMAASRSSSYYWCWLETQLEGIGNNHQPYLAQALKPCIRGKAKRVDWSKPEHSPGDIFQEVPMGKKQQLLMQEREPGFLQPHGGALLKGQHLVVKRAFSCWMNQVHMNCQVSYETCSSFSAHWESLGSEHRRILKMLRGPQDAERWGRVPSPNTK